MFVERQLVYTERGRKEIIYSFNIFVPFLFLPPFSLNLFFAFNVNINGFFNGTIIDYADTKEMEVIKEDGNKLLKLLFLKPIML